MCLTKCLDKYAPNAYAFGALILRLAFGILFTLVAVKKLRMGYGGFAESLVTADTLMAKEIPHMLLLAYGYVLPAAELIVGVLLLANKYVREAIAVIAIIYLTFVFGQMYNLNTAKIGTEYFPSLLALWALVLCREKAN